MSLPFPLWVVGVLMSILASFCNTTGLLLQKFAHQRLAEDAKGKEKQRSDALEADMAAAAAADAVVIEEEEEEEEDESESDGGWEDDKDITSEVPGVGSGRKVGSNAHETEAAARRASAVRAIVQGDGSSGKKGKKKKKKNQHKSVLEDEDNDGEEEEEEEEVLGYWRHPVWVMGFGMVVIGALLDVATFGFAPQSLLAPIASMSLVFNTLLAPRFLGETLSARDIAATGVIVVGTVVVVVFAPHETPEYTVQDMRDLYTRPITIIYFIVNGGVMLLLFMITGKFSVDKKPTGVWKKLYPFSFPTLAGILGGMSVLFSKCGIEMVKTSVATENQFVYPEPYVFIVCIAIFLVLQVKFLNAGLALFDALYVIPVYQVWWMISGILGGSFFFNEFRNFDTMQWIFFPVGTFINIVGIYVLTQRGGSEEEAAADEAEAAAAAERGETSPGKSPGLSRAARKQVMALDAQRRASMLFFGVDNSAVAAMGTHEQVNRLAFAVPSPMKPAIRRVSRMMHRHFAHATSFGRDRRVQRRSSAMAAPVAMRLVSEERREMDKQRRRSEMASLSRPNSSEAAPPVASALRESSRSAGGPAVRQPSMDVTDPISD